MFKFLKRYIKEKKYPFYMMDNKKYKNYDIGEYTYGRPKVYAEENINLKIGKFCSIAMNTSIYLGSEHRTNWVTTYPFFAKFDEAKQTNNTTKGDVNIGNDVWIADGAIILSGVTIGDGAVVGARAVVSKDVKPYEIVAGNPARHIRYRFDEDTISELLKIKWWDWNIEKIKDNFDLILSSNINNFINQNNNTGDK
jgi:acetyltransferase-like isoleucine patch superfamily enzyme